MAALFAVSFVVGLFVFFPASALGQGDLEIKGLSDQSTVPAGSKIEIMCFGQIEVYHEGSLIESGFGKIVRSLQETGEYFARCEGEAVSFSVESPPAAESIAGIASKAIKAVSSGVIGPLLGIASTSSASSGAGFLASGVDVQVSDREEIFGPAGELAVSAARESEKLQAVYSIGKRHYTEGGETKEIKTDFEPVTGEFDWAAEKNAFRSYIGGNKISIKGAKGGSVEFAVPSEIPPQVSGNKATYILSGLDAELELALTSGGIEKLITLYSHPTGEDFTYWEEFEMSGSGFFVGGLYIWYDACVYDEAAGEDICERYYYPTEWRYSDGKIGFTISEEWLSSAIFPVYIDPAVYYNFTDTSGNKAYFKGSDNINQPPTDWAQCWDGEEVGVGDYGNLNSLNGVGFLAPSTKSGYEPWTRLNFTINEPIPEIEWVYVSMTQKDVDNGQKGEVCAYIIANFSASAWQAFGATTNGGTYVTRSKNFTSGFSQIINTTTNQLVLLSEGAAHDSSEGCDVDFAEVRVGYSPKFSVVLVAPENETSTSDSTPGFSFTVSGTRNTYSCELLVGGSVYGTNGSVQNATQTTITASPALADGNYNWKINCTAGGFSNLSETRKITIDTAPPALSFEPPTEDNTSTITKTWTEVNVTIDDANFDSFVLNWGGENQTYKNTSSEMTKFNSTRHIFYLNVSPLINGTYTYYAWANDTAGSSSYTSGYIEESPRYLYVDLAGLEEISVQINSPENSSYINDTTPEINFTVTGTSAYYACTLYFNNTAKGVNGTTENGVPTVIEADSPIDDGYYLFNVTCVNGSLINTSQGNLTLDNRGPEIEISSPQSGSRTNSELWLIVIYVSEPYLNLTNVSIINSLGAVVNSSANASAGTVYFYLSVYMDGVYNITATAYDLAGNNNSTLVSDIVLDRAPPTLALLTLNDTSPVAAGNVTFTLDFSEAMNQTVNPTVKIQNSSIYTITAFGWFNSTRWIGWYNFTTETGDGNYMINVTGAKDLTGNIMDGDTQNSFILDTNAPEVFEPHTYSNTTLLSKTDFQHGNAIFINATVTDISGAEFIESVLITITNTTGGVV
ncbi:MAG: hypothetical protein ACP5E4_02860, partial [Candidatus Aenigmatarchaeota archaeon]